MLWKLKRYELSATVVPVWLRPATFQDFLHVDGIQVFKRPHAHPQRLYPLVSHPESCILPSHVENKAMNGVLIDEAHSMAFNKSLLSPNLLSISANTYTTHIKCYIYMHHSCKETTFTHGVLIDHLPVPSPSSCWDIHSPSESHRAGRTKRRQ